MQPIRRETQAVPYIPDAGDGRGTLIPCPDMNAGRLVYKTILQISKQYSSNRLPLTGIVGFSQSRFRYPVSQAVKEVFNAQRDNPDLDCKCAVQRHMLSCFCVAHETGVRLMSS